MKKTETSSLAITQVCNDNVVILALLHQTHFWPRHEAVGASIFTEGFPLWGLPSMGKVGKSKFPDISFFDPPKIQRSVFLSQYCVINHNLPRGLFCPFPYPLLSMWSPIFFSLEKKRPRHKHVTILLISFGLAPLLWVLLQISLPNSVLANVSPLSFFLYEMCTCRSGWQALSAWIDMNGLILEVVAIEHI